MAVNISEVLRERASMTPDAVGLVEGYGDRRRLTWAELDAQADAVAGWLSARGLVAGHRVGIVLSNRIEFVAAFLGAARRGLVVVPMNPRSTTGELVRMIADSGSRVVFCEASNVSIVREAAQSLAEVLAGADEALRAGSVVPHLVVVGGGERSGEVGYEVVAARDDGPETMAPVDDEALSTLLYTSGTSGQPRGVMLSHRAMLANVEQVAALDPPVITPDDVVLGLLPLFHIYGLNGVLGTAVRQGVRVVLADRFDPTGTLDLVRAEGVTNIPLAPPVIAAWAGRDDLREKLAGVRQVMCGASALDPVLAALFARSSGVVVEQGYGLTETAPVLTVTLAGHGRRPDGIAKPGSVGSALAGIDIRIVDASGGDADPGDPGEIWVRGPNLFSGYWPDGSDGPDAAGWFATGDVGIVDADGDLSLVDRLRELVIVSGFNVYPHEVEDVIAELPSVAEAAVIGVPTAETGEAVQAFVVAADASQRPDELASTIRNHCEYRLARFKWPGHITVISGLPHSATGKVAKGRLRALARRDTLGLD